MTRWAVVLAFFCFLLVAIVALGGHTAFSSERNRVLPPGETFENLLKQFPERAPGANAAITPGPFAESSPGLLNVPPGLLERYPTIVLPLDPEASVRMPHVNPDPGVYYRMPQIVEPPTYETGDFVFLEREAVPDVQMPQRPESDNSEKPRRERRPESEPDVPE
jgi:hypothetical protein